MSLSMKEWAALDRADLRCFEAREAILDIKKQHRHRFVANGRDTSHCYLCGLYEDDICHGAQL